MYLVKDVITPGRGGLDWDPDLRHHLSSSAEGDYIDTRPEPSQWFFGGGEPGEPKILDDAMLVLDGG